ALRKIQSSVWSGGITAARIRMAPGAALFLLNNKRKDLSKIEHETNIRIVVYADGRLKSEEYELELETARREVEVVRREAQPTRLTQDNKAAAGNAESRSGSHRDNDRRGGGGRGGQRRSGPSGGERGERGGKGGRGGRRGGRNRSAQDRDGNRGRGGRGGRGRRDARANGGSNYAADDNAKGGADKEASVSAAKTIDTSPPAASRPVQEN
ncbi:MAG: hypothetical protein KDD44_09775, partial [Bdellovibrionales bacterium]|nr:hypothetical protein [Bdellovibrionales bacterium]